MIDLNSRSEKATIEWRLEDLLSWIFCSGPFPYNAATKPNVYISAAARLWTHVIPTINWVWHGSKSIIWIPRMRDVDILGSRSLRDLIAEGALLVHVIEAFLASSIRTCEATKHYAHK